EVVEGSVPRDLSLVGLHLPCRSCPRSVLGSLLVRGSCLILSFLCREWRRLASDDELWSELFKKRWGSDCAASYAPTGSKSWKDVYAVRQASEDDASWYRLFKKRWGSGNAVFYAPRGSKSWKDVYEAHDRCDLLDLDFKLIRKGGHYYVIRGDYIHKYVPSGEGAKLPPGFGDRKKIDSASLEEDE
ncbi:unnamed protein product, partial [Musa hybrid cultivar]